MTAIQKFVRSSEIESSISIDVPHPSEKIAILVKALRLVAMDSEIKSRELIIPDSCEQYGFAEGKHNLGILVQFLADMLEE